MTVQVGLAVADRDEQVAGDAELVGRGRERRFERAVGLRLRVCRPGRDADGGGQGQAECQ